MTGQLILATVAVLLLVAGGWALYAMKPDQQGLAGMKTLVRRTFPSVTQVSPQRLLLWLQETHPPLLLDVRTPAEYAVSHLPGARQVDPKAKAEEVLPLLLEQTHRPVVVYCSVGYRSSALAERLMKAGITNASNLEGSIFAWANAGLPLEAAGQPASTVHPYNTTFGRLLKEPYRAKLPLKEPGDAR